MQQFDREYFAERKAQIKRMHHVRSQFWQTIVAGVTFVLIMQLIRESLKSYSYYNYRGDLIYKKIWIFPGHISAAELITFSETILQLGLLLTASTVVLLSVRYFILRGIHRDIQQEYQLLRPHMSPHEKAKRSGYEYEEVTWPDDDGEFPDDIRLEEQIHQRTYSND